MVRNKHLNNVQHLTNTEFERLALAGEINLSDGHARQPLTPTQRKFIAGTLEIFDRASQVRQEDLEAEFLSSFFACARQTGTHSAGGLFLTYSSSSAIKIAAQYCRLRGLDVLLIEPCFDNIRHMLLTEGVHVRAVQESTLMDTKAIASLVDSNIAVWIVQPNNPTGFTLDEKQFRHLVEVLTGAGSTLIVDYCFRFYARQLDNWDQYQALRDSRCSFLAIEDTGKTWGFSDIKVGITVSSEDASGLLHRLHDELLLNVSGLHLAILSKFVEDSFQQGLDISVRQPVDENRKVVHLLIEPDRFSHASQHCHNVPMEFLSLPKEIDSVHFWKQLRRSGVDILPASNYYWTDPTIGKSRIRIPLARDPAHLELAVPKLGQALTECLKG